MYRSLENKKLTDHHGVLNTIRANVLNLTRTANLYFSYKINTLILVIINKKKTRENYGNL